MKREREKLFHELLDLSLSLYKFLRAGRRAASSATQLTLALAGGVRERYLLRVCSSTALDTPAKLAGSLHSRREFPLCN
jgi:hypothetical protein